jgi:hypothetical protein
LLFILYNWKKEWSNTWRSEWVNRLRNKSRISNGERIHITCPRIRCQHWATSGETVNIHRSVPLGFITPFTKWKFQSSHFIRIDSYHMFANTLALSYANGERNNIHWRCCQGFYNTLSLQEISSHHRISHSLSVLPLGFYNTFLKFSHIVILRTNRIPQRWGKTKITLISDKDEESLFFFQVSHLLF